MAVVLPVPATQTLHFQESRLFLDESLLICKSRLHMTEIRASEMLMIHCVFYGFVNA